MLEASVLAASRNSMGDWKRTFRSLFGKGDAVGDVTYSSSQQISGIIYAKNLTINSGVTLTVMAPVLFIVGGNFTNNGNIQNQYGGINDDTPGYIPSSVDRIVFPFTTNTPQRGDRSNIGYSSGSANYGQGGRSLYGYAGSVDYQKLGWLDYPNVPHWWVFSLFRSQTATLLRNSPDIPFHGTPSTPFYAPLPPGAGLDQALPIASLNWNQPHTYEDTTPSYKIAPSVEIFCQGSVVNSGASSIISNGFCAGSYHGGGGGTAGSNVGILAFGNLTNSGTISASGSPCCTCCEGGGGGGGIWLMAPSIVQGSVLVDGGTSCFGGTGEGTGYGTAGIAVFDTNSPLFS